MKWKEIQEPFYSFFLCPSAGGKQRGVLFFKHIKLEILMIYRERKRERKRASGGGVGGRQGGLNMMQTIWSGEWRLPAQPALFKLERK